MIDKNNNKLIPLGKKINYKFKYNPLHLFPISRKDSRKNLGIINEIPFTGNDIWNCYEISWLDFLGKPQVAIARFIFPFNTENIIESKSIKLYFNSFNQTCFKSHKDVKQIIENDLSNIAKGKVFVSLILPENFSKEKLFNYNGILIDNINLKMEEYIINPDFLFVCKQEKTSEKLFSNLLRTNCPVTSQPDWASIIIEYSGKKINHKGLLKYLISFREHTGFHENCVERIFMDILKKCKPEKLLVYARFTRRGGIDINPYRANYDVIFSDIRFPRQ